GLGTTGLLSALGVVLVVAEQAAVTNARTTAPASRRRASLTSMPLGSGRLVEAARIELASEAASRKNSTSVVPVLDRTCPTPVGPDSDRLAAVLSLTAGRDARRDGVSV